MTRQIWKWQIQPNYNNIIEMPANAEILTVQTQHGQPCIWALCDSAMLLETRNFRIIPTGHTIDIDNQLLHYIGSFQVNNDTLVFHLFEIFDANKIQ